MVDVLDCRSGRRYWWVVLFSVAAEVTATRFAVGWMSTFPFDVIKTRMQGVDEQPPPIAGCPIAALPSPSSAYSPLLSRTYSTNVVAPVNPYRTIWSTIVNSYRSEGIQVFYRGLSPALIRFVFSFHLLNKDDDWFIISAIPVNMATFVTFEAVVYALSWSVSVFYAYILCYNVQLPHVVHNKAVLAKHTAQRKVELIVCE